MHILGWFFSLGKAEGKRPSMTSASFQAILPVGTEEVVRAAFSRRAALPAAWSCGLMQRGARSLQLWFAK